MLNWVVSRAGIELFAIRNGEADPFERRREAREAPTVREMVDILHRGGDLNDELMAAIGDYLRQYAPDSDSE